MNTSYAADAAVVSCRSIRRRNKVVHWNRDMLLGLLGIPWSLQDGRVEVDSNSDGEPRSGGRTDVDENQKRRERQTHLHHEEDDV